MKACSINEILALFQPGESVYIAGSSAEPRPLVQALNQHSQDLPPLELVHSFVPGVNNIPLASGDNQLTETAVFPRSAADKINLIPATYFGYNQYLNQRDFDWAIVQLSPPDKHGRHCLGPSVEFMPTVLQRSRRVIGIINPNIPVIPGSHFVDQASIKVFCEMDAPLVSYDAGTVDAVSEKISGYLAELIADGSTLQLGLGKVPTRLLENLTDRRNLRFHTGLLTAGFMTLLKAGAVDDNYTHTTCASLGDADFYQQLSEAHLLMIAGVGYTHAPENLTKLDSLIAVNSALQVDLSGQANLEYMGKRKISSAGGAPDFAQAAYQSSDGKSIIALPATAAKGSISRIQKILDPSNPVSLHSEQIDYVVTEYGIANLTGKSMAARAEAMVKIAAPEFQDALMQTD